MAYAQLPNTPTLRVEPFKVDIPQADIDELHQLIRLSRIPKAVYESTQIGEDYGVTRDWLLKARDAWLELDWKKQQDRINSIPAYVATVQNEDGRDYDIHFAALFSKKKDATPILFSHGWPGAYLEFIPLFEHVREKYSEDELPFHLIAPSLPGWLFSTSPPLDKEFSIEDVAYLFDSLLKGLGFASYVPQGGDIGAGISRILSTYDSVKFIHLNFVPYFIPPEGTPEAKDAPLGFSDFLDAVKRFGYALEHGTRPSTAGLVIGSSPISLLAWVGEKFNEWSDVTPDLDTILTFVTLYWVTDSFPSTLYNYRYSYGVKNGVIKAGKYLEKPFGYSHFAHELLPSPIHWAEHSGNLVWARKHDKGGHFAALERPKVLWADVEEFVLQNWDK